MTGNEEKRMRADTITRARAVQRRLNTRTAAARDADAAITDLCRCLELLESRYEMAIQHLHDLQPRRITH